MATLTHATVEKSGIDQLLCLLLSHNTPARFVVAAEVRA
jgi:hypothetical protein